MVNTTLYQRERVEQLVVEQDRSHDIVCDNLKKVYPGRDGNPEKIAVRGLSLALSTGECFGMLGPNGAGKTSFINMVSAKASFILNSQFALVYLNSKQIGDLSVVEGGSLYFNFLFVMRTVYPEKSTQLLQ